MAKGYIGLVVIGVLNTLISIYYYLRLVVNMYMQKEERTILPSYGMVLTSIISIMAILMIILGIIPGYLLEIAAKAAIFTL